MCESAELPLGTIPGHKRTTHRRFIKLIRVAKLFFSMRIGAFFAEITLPCFHKLSAEFSLFEARRLSQLLLRVSEIAPIAFIATPLISKKTHEALTKNQWTYYDMIRANFRFIKVKRIQKTWLISKIGSLSRNWLLFPLSFITGLLA